MAKTFLTDDDRKHIDADIEAAGKSVMQAYGEKKVKRKVLLAALDEDIHNEKGFTYKDDEVYYAQQTSALYAPYFVAQKDVIAGEHRLSEKQNVVVNYAKANHLTLTDSANATVQGLIAYIDSNTKGVDSLELTVRGKNIANNDFYESMLFSGFAKLLRKGSRPYTPTSEGYGLSVVISCRAGVTYGISANITDLPNGFITATVYNNLEEAYNHKNALHGDGAKLSKGLVLTAKYNGVLVVHYHCEWAKLDDTNGFTIPSGFIPYIAAESTLSEFVEPIGTTYTIKLPKPCYGGRVNFQLGKYVQTYTLQNGTATKLATPVTYDISGLPKVSTKYPITSIFSNSGQVAVDYVVDLKNYIDNKFNELATAMIANT